MPGLMLIAMAAVSLATAPTPPRMEASGAWLGNVGVPARILKRGERVRTRVSIAVSPDGAPRDCTVTRSSGHAMLDDRICAAVIANGHFQPARDHMGKPVAGTFDFAWMWEAFDTAIDAATSKAAPPKRGSDAGLWVTTSDLPRGALKRGEVVVSDMLITVSATGRVADCTITDPSTHPELDQHACRLVKARGHYRPARDAAGRPTEGIDWMRSRWQAPVD
ncbi:energy transducer TonB [Rhizorhabdus dicambivorans]|nr:TonB family protein [Rhizorhabdus dicambivorans]